MPPGAQTIEENLRAAMCFFGEAAPNGEVRSASGVQMVFSGMDYGVFNIAVLTQPVATERDLVGILAACGHYYRDQRVRWSFWMCEDMLEHGARRRSRQVFADAGMRVISRAPGMTAGSLAPLSRPLPDIECRAVTDAESRSAFAALTMTCFDIPVTVARAIYEPEAAWKGVYHGFVGLVDGAPVSIVALARAGGALGVYSLGTLPEHRHKGYGEALLRAAEASYRNADEPLVLESTDAGYRLYRRLGFSDTTSFTVYLTR